MKRVARSTLLGLLSVLTACAASYGAPGYRVQDDAIPQSLTGLPGDAARGRQIVASRDANCLLCHAIPDTAERFMGNVGPPLAGVGRRLTAGQLRLRIVDPTRVNPEAVMPAYYRTHDLDRVAAPLQDRPVLSASEVEDVVAYLVTLQ